MGSFSNGLNISLNEGFGSARHDNSGIWVRVHFRDDPVPGPWRYFANRLALRNLNELLLSGDHLEEAK